MYASEMPLQCIATFGMTIAFKSDAWSGRGLNWKVILNYLKKNYLCTNILLLLQFGLRSAILLMLH